MWEPFTERARRVVILAGEAAAEQKNPQINTEHFLLGIISDAFDGLERILAKYGLTFDSVKEKLTPPSAEEAAKYGVTSTLFAKETKVMLEGVFGIARSFNMNYISPLHFLLAISRAPKSAGYRILRKIIPDDKEFRKFALEIKQFTEKGGLTTKSSAKPKQSAKSAIVIDDGLEKILSSLCLEAGLERKELLLKLNGPIITKQIKLVQKAAQQLEKATLQLLKLLKI